MEIIIHNEDNSLKAQFIGRFDTAVSSQAEQDMQPLFSCEGQDIVLDCEELEYISSSGLRLFLSLLKTSMSKGVDVYISGANMNIKKVLMMTGFHRLFKYK